MELRNFMIEALKERFKATSIVDALKKEIVGIAKHRTFEKYKDKILINFSDNMEFELIDVKVEFYCYDTIELPKITLKLGYFCKSKLPKAKREKLAKVKAVYMKEEWMPWNNYKVPIWKELRYSIELADILSNNINLDIREP